MPASDQLPSGQTDTPFQLNKTLFQSFEWYVPPDGAHWRRLTRVIPDLASIGITAMWLPPGCKAASSQSNGYDIYDLYDLGEFEQKGSRATKWGTRQELEGLAAKAAEEGVGLLWDAVLNHRAGADSKEVCWAVNVDPKDRRKEIEAPKEIEAWTTFDFPGRGDRYSAFKYHWYHFSGINWDSRSNSDGIFKIVGNNKPGWAEDVSPENGNYDYLMFADMDYSQADVCDEVRRWGEWIGQELKLSGMRLDAIKHYSEGFLKSFVAHLDRTVGKDWFFVGEYWSGNARVLGSLIRRFERISLFDAPLVYRLSAASSARKFDLRSIFDGTLCKRHPRNSVTFVANHDTQETQALAAPVQPWFVPHAYALILFRLNSGTPCVFYGDIYGIKGPKPRQPACRGKLTRYILARKLLAYGPQYDYLDNPSTIGWTRSGDQRVSCGAGMAVVMTNEWDYAGKKMYVGKQHVGERWTEVMGWVRGEILIDRKGWGKFPVGPRSVAVWASKDAECREKIDGLVFDCDIYQEFGDPAVMRVPL